VPSVTFIWPGAEWPEREAYDMFGIIYEGNRDLRRIYMPPDYTSFPLRKDFLLPDDASRSPGEGVRHVEQTHQPAENMRQPQIRMAPQLGDNQISTLSQLPEETEAPPA
jgi:NADH:ubiquinone oxidoreductase subunit C